MTQKTENANRREESRRLEDRVSALEKVLTTHLEESGTIRTDLAWLKKAFWTMTGALVTFNFAVVFAVVSKFMK